MAVQRFKVAFNNARLPLISTQAQRAVFVPSLDAAPRVSSKFAGADDSVDYNLAQVIFSENVMPAAHGINSVGYVERVPAAVGRSGFDSMFALRDSKENVVLYSPSGGNNNVYNPETGVWTNTTLANTYGTPFIDFNVDPTSCHVSYAYVEGFTFVCFSGLTATLDDGEEGTYTRDSSIWWWDPEAARLEPALGVKYSSLPFAMGAISGIGSSSGYLIVYSGIHLAWAPYNGATFDFNPYDNNAYTGAGKQIPEDIQAPITAVISLSGGFLAFTSRNCIAATYHAQDLNSHWIFREVANAGGISTYEQATVESSLGYCFAYTTGGLQKISLNSAEMAFPGVSDFLAGRRIERISSDNLLRIEGSTTLDFYVKLSAAGNRYLVISYGTRPQEFTHALVYDIGLDRWGKLRVDHVDCFYFNRGGDTGNLTYIMFPGYYSGLDANLTYEGTTGYSTTIGSAQHSVAFMQSNGRILQADWSESVREVDDNAVAVIGRIQLTRTSNTQLNRVELDGAVAVQAYAICSLDGGDSQPAVPLVQISQSETTTIFGELLDAKNFSIAVVGTFQLSSMILEATTSGRM